MNMCMYYKNRPSANWTCIKFSKNICDSLPLTEYFRINRRICGKMCNIATILDTEQDRTLHHNIKLQPNSNLVLGGYSVYWIESSTIKAFFERDFTSIFASSHHRIIVIARNYGECSRQSSDEEKTTDRSVRWLFWQEYGVFSRVRSARYDDRVAEIIIRDQHLEEWLLFKDAEQQISARSSSSRQRSFHSPCRCLFFYFDARRCSFIDPKPIMQIYDTFRF